MFQNKTVFVVGAGASTEVGLPMGTQLKSIIAKKLNIKFKHGQDLESGDWKIVAALREFCRNDSSNIRGDINPHRASAVQISEGIFLTSSIDNYLNAHNGDKRIELCGKLGIALSILEAEKKCKLWIDPNNPRTLNFGALEQTWYMPLYRMLNENIHKKDVDRIFDNVSFITFNYDRCIEHFLINALMVFYSIPEIRAQEIVSNAVIIHPYGQVGRLNWQHGGDTPFGAEVEGWHLIKISEQIRTFTEQYEDPNLQSAIQETLAQASTAVFLGFAYHEINMATIKLGTERNISRVFGTAFGMSPSDVQSATRDVRNSICIPDAEVLLNNNIKSFDLFNEYWKSLPK